MTIKKIFIYAAPFLTRFPKNFYELETDTIMQTDHSKSSYRNTVRENI